MEDSIAAALKAARTAIPIGEARLLLRQVLGCSAAYLEAHSDDALPTEAAVRFSALARRRAAGEPIAYLTGFREFYGRDFAVSPEVLIPRPETELLVDLAVSSLRGIRSPSVLDLGTGSGCIAVTLALELELAEITASDISPDALAMARLNASWQSADIRCVHSDWFEALGDTQYHLIVANPPYIPSGDPHLNQGDLRFEPPRALASGVDGLAAIRRIVEDSIHHLLPGGGLWFEHGYDQADQARTLLQEAGYSSIEQHRDLAGIIRVSGGRLVPALGSGVLA
ncbi:MAG: peptide chain release factor N(5)-glutamine methyltransferase [Proteobacteria bacterium]|nr:peptide chain release factor N(5)-glutamine methyltransferase [Pseudomonadota bacterium]